MSFHKNMTGENVHVTYSFTYANAAAREAATGLTSADIGKVAKQTDTRSFWILMNDSPVTWGELTRTTAATIGGVVTVGKSGTVGYNNVLDALAYVQTKSPSPVSPWTIIIYPGAYVEQPMTVPLGVTLMSIVPSPEAVVITAADPLHDLITLQGGTLSGLSLGGVYDPTKALIRAIPNLLTKGSLVNAVALTNCSQGMVVQGGAIVISNAVVVRCLTPNSAVDKGIVVDGAGSIAYLTTLGLRTRPEILPYYPGRDPITTGVYVINGGTAEVNGAIVKLDYNTSDQAAFLLVGDDSEAKLQGSNFESGNIAIRIASGAAVANVQGCDIENHNYNFVVDSSTGVVFAQYGTDSIKESKVPGAVITGIASATNHRTTALNGNVTYVYESDREAAVGEYLYDNASSGVLGSVTLSSAGLDVTVGAQSGWVRRESDEDLVRVSWEESTVTLTPNATNYVFYNGETLAVESNTTGTNTSNIDFAIAYTDGTRVRFLHNVTAPTSNITAKLNSYLLDTRKFTFKSGLACSVGSGVTKFDVGSGTYFIANVPISLTGANDASFSYFYGTNGATEVASTVVDTTNYDNAGVLTPMTAGFYRADTVYLTSDDRISVIYGTEEFATLVAAEAAARQTAPDFIAPSGFAPANMIVKQGVGIDSFVDFRSSYNSGGATGVASGGGVTVHGLLSGLAADDHTQYLLGSGARPMSGNLNMGGNNVVNVNLVDGVDVSAHGSRHDPNNIDAIATAAPIALVIGATPSEGTASSTSRSDHQHGIEVDVPVTIGTVNSEGTGSKLSRNDHVHAHGNQAGGSLHGVAVAGVSAGFLSAADKTKLDGIAASATNTPLTSSAPAQVTKSAAVVGVDTSAARADHKHDIATGVPVAIGSVNSEGVASTLARSDHVHQGAVSQTQEAALSADVTTGSTAFSDLITTSITLSGASYLILRFTVSFSAVANDRQGTFRILVDGTPVVGTAQYCHQNFNASAACQKRVSGLSAGVHTVKVQWKSSGNNIRCQPISQPDTDHAVLSLQETTV